MSGDKKADPALLSEITKETKLKHVETEEKNPLPSVEAISQEKTVQAISSFDKSNLKHTEVDEKSGWKEAICHDNAVKGVDAFDKAQLKHATTEEKNPLPDKQTIEEEKREQEHRKSIGEFDKSKLQRRETEEKIVLPSQEAINQEKQEKELMDSIGGHDKASMKKVETHERDALKEIVAQEQTHKGIEQFNKDNLRKSQTLEKNPLPTKEDIEAEKSAK